MTRDALLGARVAFAIAVGAEAAWLAVLAWMAWRAV